MSKYAMVMDLNRCIGCNACVIACKVEHNTPIDIHFTQILEREIGEYPQVQRQFLPTMCNHCDAAPCIDVCPTKATYARDKDGIVLIDWEKCIGCGGCILACPYDQRSPVHDNRTVFPDGGDFRSTVVTRAPAGVTVKCDFCYHRIDVGKEPACVEACPTNARIFGERAGEKMSTLIDVEKAWTLLPEKGAQPGVYYVD